MDLPEHLGKAQLAAAGVRIPSGGLAATASEAGERARELGGEVVVKAQVPAGRRGKAGAVWFAGSPDEAARAAEDLLGREVAGFVVERVLVEERVPVERELYAAVLNDPTTRSPLLLFSAAGGMDVEEVAPERLPVGIREGVTRAGLEEWLVTAAAPPDAAASLDRAALATVATALARMYELYRSIDAELIEVNPLALTAAGEVIALDAKVTLDPGARPRQQNLFELAEATAPEAGTPLEREARRQGFLLIELDGDVGILANGAGLTMATIDAVVHRGGRPANFLEIGGDAYTRALPALRLVLSNPNVRSLLVNFCGAFARTDVMTEGVVAAIEELRPEVPISFSIHGTGEDEAIAIVRDRLGIEPHDLMDDAVREAM